MIGVIFKGLSVEIPLATTAVQAVNHGIKLSIEYECDVVVVFNDCSFVVRYSEIEGLRSRILN